MITPNQIREKKISTALSDGYDRSEVNELLVEIIDSYEAVCFENKELYRKMEILAGKIEEYREDEDSIKTAIISAQKTAHQISREAKEKSDEMLAQSTAEAQQTVLDAKEKADKIVGEAREYVADLTQEKTAAAEQLIAEAKEKANAAISSAELIAQDAIENAKKITQELVANAKQERIENEKIAAALRSESKQFRSMLMELYEAQLSGLKELKLDEPLSVADDAEKKLDELMDRFENELPDNVITPADDEETEVVENADDTEPAEVTSDFESSEADSADTAESDEASVLSNMSEAENLIDEIDEIINEIEANGPVFEPIDDDEEEIPTEEEIASAINAFTQDEITPVEEMGATIPVIEEEPEFESVMPFENFFNVHKGDTAADEVISLTAPDEDDEDDDDDKAKFKGFFKKKK